MSKARGSHSRRTRWTVLFFALVAVAYLGTVLWKLFNEADMALGLIGSERQGIERFITAREHVSPARDTVLTPRQISVILDIAEDISRLAPDAALAQRVRGILVHRMNASSMTLAEYRRTRSRVEHFLSDTARVNQRDSLTADRMSVVLPRIKLVNRFFTDHLDSIGLAPF